MEMWVALMNIPSTPVGDITFQPNTTEEKHPVSLHLLLKQITLGYCYYSRFFLDKLQLGKMALERASSFLRAALTPVLDTSHFIALTLSPTVSLLRLYLSILVSFMSP